MPPSVAKMKWIVTVLLSVVLVLVASIHGQLHQERCTETGDWVTCKDITTIQHVSNELKSNWTKIAIENGVLSSFEVSSHISPYIQNIQSLDLSKAGKVIIFEGGFKDFFNLVSLNLTQTLQVKLDPKWFRFGTSNSLEILDMSKNGVVEIRWEYLRFLNKLKIANFSNNELNIVHHNTFRENPILEVLILNGNGLTDYHFGEIKNLRRLELNHNRIVQLHTNRLLHIPKLEYLDLSYNQIDYAHNHIVNENYNLKVFNMSHNVVKEIRRHTWTGLKTRQSLVMDFGDNLISNLHHSAFEDLFNVHTIVLSGNQLATLEQQQFKNLKQLEVLRLDRNLISAIKENTFMETANLRILDLSNNILGEIKPNIFGPAKGQLKEFYASGNKLKNLQPELFSKILNVQRLSFSKNAIQTLNDNTFDQLTQLKFLDLSHNAMKHTISSNVLKFLGNIEVVDISHNNWACISDFPGAGLKLKQIYVEGNPWPCECLKKFLALCFKNDIVFARPNAYYRGETRMCVN